MIFERREDLRFVATLHCEGGTEFAGIECKLYLPKTIRERPELYAILDRDQWRITEAFMDFDLTGSLGEGVGSTIVSAKKAYFSSGSQRFWSDERISPQGYRAIKAQKLSVSRDIGEESGPIHADFNLTESTLVEPFTFQTIHDDGSVTVKKGDPLEFELSPSCNLRFLNCFRVLETEARQTLMRRELVARAEISQTSKAPIEELLPQLDNLLLLLSLAEGRRCGCMSVVWREDGKVTNLYRLDRAIPRENPEHWIDDCLVTENIGHFLRTTFDTLNQSPEHRLLYSALASMSSGERLTVQAEFLRSFAALETLVLAYRKENGLEFVLEDADQIRALRRAMKKAVHEVMGGEVDKAKRKLIYDNLPALQRVPFRHAVERLLEKREIMVDDQWPLFESESGLTLFDIRNRLAHGDSFSEREQLFGVADAADSLKAIVLRILLNALGWDYQQSTVSYKDWLPKRWKDARHLLSGE